MAGHHVSDVQYANNGETEKNHVLDFHWTTPPFTRPSGPVHLRLVNIHDSKAIHAITNSVMTNENTRG
jgi:hypothetical protein